MNRTLKKSVFDEILACTKAQVARSKKLWNLSAIERAAQGHNCRGFRQSLLNRNATAVAIIAELKKASPSKGLFRAFFPVAVLANQLSKAGASALSVVTEERFFQGSFTNLLHASLATDLPCLCKDFILDEFQIIQAKAQHADAVLLILSVLSDSDFRRLLAFAGQLGLDVLCEVHHEDELKRAIDGGAQIIGVNSRDLHTFEVKLGQLHEMACKIPDGIFRVAESGIASGAIIRSLQDSGYDAFLIGEDLMRSEHPGQRLQQLVAEAGSQSNITDLQIQ